MPIPSKPSLLSNVIGYDADVFSLPDTTVEGSGALSYESGWPRITGTSLKAGGKAPQREYFNQVNKMFSQHLFFLQSGNVYDWDASLNYNAGAHVLGSDGLEYVAVSPSGPDVPGVGAKDPAGSKNKSQWLLLAELLMSSDGGLVVDPVTGKGAVDFEQMPTDKFEALLKSIRVPIWLTKDKDFYINGTTGSDALDAGRGESAGKPFKSMNACLQYVAENYNLGRYTATINVAAGDYGRENINLPSYQATTGKIVVQGVKGDCTAVRMGAQVLVYDRIYEVRDVTVQRSNVSSGIVGSIQAEAGFIDLVNVALDTRDITYGMGSYYPLYAVTGGHIRIWATNDPDHPAGVTIIGNGNTISGWAMVQTAGLLDFAADISITGGLFFEAAGVVVANHGTWSRSNSSMLNPGRIPELVISGSYTGRRYSVATNGIISTRVAGADYLPGDIAGSVTSGGQYL